MTKTLVVTLLVKIANLSCVANAMLHLITTPNTSNTTTRIITYDNSDRQTRLEPRQECFKGLIDLSIDRLLKGFLATVTF